MRCRHLARFVALTAAVSLTPQPILAQGAPPAGDWTPPRLATGRPDLQGVWLSNTAAPLERPPYLADRAWLTDEEVADLRARAERIFRNGRSAFTTPEGAFRAAWTDVETYTGASTSSSIGMVDLEFINRTSLVVDPPDGRIPPVTAAARARAEAVDTGWRFKTGPEDLNNFHRCVTTGVPRLGGNFGAGPYTFYQLVQTPDHVAFLSEAFSRRADHPARRASASARGRPPVERRFARALGRRHPGRRDSQLLAGQLLPRRGRGTASGRAVHPDGP